MPGRIQGKVALITGGSSGIGKATALLFGREGAKVAIADYNVEGGERTAKMIQDSGGIASFHAVDVANPHEIEALIKKVVETYGRPDHAFNNAGIEGQLVETPECTIENWNRVIAINLTSVFVCMKYEIPQMLKNGGGSIVNTASVAGLQGLPTAPAYVAAKHGVAGLTKTAALEFAQRGIRINAVCPGFVSTPLVDRCLDKGAFSEAQILAAEPMHRMGRPEEIAEAVLWLCSDASSFVTGLPMPVDGGYVAQ
jgi:NAD(P)-dependent dehydrogenase (short-subunit alcohol dehydrogenase family)